MLSSIILLATASVSSVIAISPTASGIFVGTTAHDGDLVLNAQGGLNSISENAIQPKFNLMAQTTRLGQAVYALYSNELEAAFDESMNYLVAYRQTEASGYGLTTGQDFTPAEQPPVLMHTGVDIRPAQASVFTLTPNTKVMGGRVITSPAGGFENYVTCYSTDKDTKRFDLEFVPEIFANDRTKCENPIKLRFHAHK